MTLDSIRNSCDVLIFLFRIFFGRFDTSGSMIPRLVPEISSLDAFCDGAGAAGGAGIGDSRNLGVGLQHVSYPNDGCFYGQSSFIISHHIILSLISSYISYCISRYCFLLCIHCKIWLAHISNMEQAPKAGGCAS